MQKVLIMIITGGPGRNTFRLRFKTPLFLCEEFKFYAKNLNAFALKTR